MRSTAVSRLLRREAFWVALLLLGALLLRLMLHFRAPAFVSKDSQSYFFPGWSLEHGLPFELGFRRTPGYPFFIAGSVFLFGEDLRALALTQHLLGVVTVGLTYLLGKKTFGHVSGLIAGVLVAISAPLLIYERYVMTEALFGCLVTATLLAAVWALGRTPKLGARDPRSSTRRLVSQLWPFLLAGILLGMAALTRPVAQLLASLLVAGIVARSLPRWRGALFASVALGAGMLLVQGPWMVRNYVVQGNLSSSTFGRTLIARTAYYDRGFVFYKPGVTSTEDGLMKSRARQIVQELADKRSSDGVIAGRLREEFDLGPLEVNALLRDIATEAILRDPWRYVSGTLSMSAEIFVGVEERFLDHWKEYKDVNPWNPRVAALVGDPTAWEVRERSTAHRLADIYEPANFAPVTFTLFCLGCVAAVASSRARPALLPALAAIGLIVASAALDGPVERYRYPVDPSISVLVAGGLVSSTLTLWRLGVPRRSRQTASARP
ncbi:MAG: glycosyltransferase family 39 protein [Chloroflexi bacterium]|nr:glycosyltransferase family 39 protein [Chloroflexota bacterium]